VSIDDKGKVFINKDEVQADLLETSLKDAKAKTPKSACNCTRTMA
jgi:biopolymer transport protein ExbD